MKNGIRATLVSKRSFFLCLTLLASGSVGGIFTIPIFDKDTEAERADTHLSSDKGLASTHKIAVQAVAVVAHRKASDATAALPSFRNVSSSDGRDDDVDRSTRSRSPMAVVGDRFVSGESTSSDTQLASDSSDQADYAAGNYAPGGGTSLGVQGAQSSLGLASTTPGGAGCITSEGAMTTLPFDGGFCFVAEGGSSGVQNEVVAQADIDSQTPVIRQSFSDTQGRDGGGTSGGTTVVVSGPSMSNTPPDSPSGSPPNLTPPVVVDVSPFTNNPVIQINEVSSNLSSFTPAGDPPGSTAVPEPATLGLMFLGLFGLVVARNSKTARRLPG